ncbi:MAG: hypothetical protein ACKVI4_17790, partial [Actinomycetales bacterium]
MSSNTGYGTMDGGSPDGPAAPPPPPPPPPPGPKKSSSSSSSSSSSPPDCSPSVVKSVPLLSASGWPDMRRASRRRAVAKPGRSLLLPLSIPSWRSAVTARANRPSRAPSRRAPDCVYTERSPRPGRAGAG